MTSDNSLQKLDHIAIQVADVPKAVHWYTTSFACRVRVQEAAYAEIEFENIVLCLTLPSQEPPHLGFARSDARSFGVTAAGRDGRPSLYLADPSGNVIELIQDTP